MTVNRWIEAEHARSYLEQRRHIPHLQEGYEALLEFLPARVGRVLDLGCGDGEVVGRVVEAHPRVRERFAGSDRVTVVEHDLDASLPAEWGRFDAVVSAFAIHHLADERKRALYAEIYDRLRPGGAFLNLEHVASPTCELHEAFLARLGLTPEHDDPSNQLAPAQDQLAWLREIGFEQVDCHWKWRELALLAGVHPG
jgi:tRNA (cmo5U34)-methyltransferase